MYQAGGQRGRALKSHTHVRVPHPCRHHAYGRQTLHISHPFYGIVQHLFKRRQLVLEHELVE